MAKNLVKDKKKMFGSLFVLLSTILLAVVLIRSNELPQIISALESIDIKYIIIAVLCLFGFWYLEAFMIFVLITKFTNKKQSYRTIWLAVKTTLIGQYYSNITPFASGGQPVQLYIMNEENVPLSEGTVILLSKFLLFQIGVTIYSLVLAIYRVKYLLSLSQGIPIFVFTGLTINLLMLTGFIMIAFKPNVIESIVSKIINFLFNRKIVKNKVKTLSKAKKFMAEYENSINRLNENTPMLLQLFALTFVQLTLFFSITFFIYKSLHLSGAGIIDIICLQAFLYMAVSFIPTPGTAGVSEAGFVMILGSVFSKNIIGTALILWRGISYYFSLIFSGVFSILVTAFEKRKRIGKGRYAR